MDISNTKNSELLIKKPIDRLKRKTSTDNLWIYILRILQEKEVYGYELRDLIINRFDFKPGKVTSYRVLADLIKFNLVTSFIIDNPDGKPNRKYYRITEKGQKMMQEAKKYMTNLLVTVFDKSD
ncbi:MAG: helix-turn-helix transcriptional regulator [Asgard group archaeon]|nr:helix-turn-helix transcriptional regulator [Asgard group archaeon]